MERLNLRTAKTSDYSSESEKTELIIKFFCVSEGATEESYFEGVRNNRVVLKIKNEVIIEVIPKEEGQETYSHPKQLVDACLTAMGRMDSEGNDIPEEEWDKNCKWKDYKKETDIVCVVFDRDYRNIDEYFDEIFEKCNKNNIRIVMSNPNFEFWLLMHFPNIGQYDRKKLLENPKNLKQKVVPGASKHKKYLEILVSQAAQGYSKGCKIKFEKFLPQLSLAMNQAEQFCEEAEGLKTELGSAVGKLIKSMRE